MNVGITFFHSITLAWSSHCPCPGQHPTTWYVSIH